MSGPRKLESPSSRVAVPMLFDGAYRSVLICTFGAQLEFFEEVLRRQLASCRNQIVLADSTRLAVSVAAAASGGQLRHLNRTYVAAPINHSHAAHAKLILLTGPEAGMLLVGSGNLNFSGYAGAGECFAAYAWTPDDQQYLRDFQAAKRFVDGMVARGLLEDFARTRIERMWETTEWIHRAAPSGEAMVRHNFDQPLARQFIEAVGGEAVEELIIAAPFFDAEARALRRLRDALGPMHTTVLVQPKRTSVDASALAGALHGGGSSSVHPVSGPGEPYLHAKLFIARTATRSISLTGSANCSNVALFNDHPAANLELGNLIVGKPDEFDHLLSDITIGPASDPRELELGLDPDDEQPDVEVSWRLTDVTWRPPVLRGVVRPSLPSDASVTLVVGGVAIDDVTVTLEPLPDGHRFEAQIMGDAADLIDNVVGVALAVHPPREPVQHSAPTVAYQLAVLEALDARRFSAERLRAAATLELDDPELASLLGELEQLLIPDGRSAWRMAHTDPPPTEPEDDASTFPWELIDWSLVRQHPRFVSYRHLLSVPSSTPGELASYLNALSAALRELVDPDAVTATPELPGVGAEDEDEDEDERTEGVEGAGADDADEKEDEAERRRQSAKARNLRVIRNFVRRNLGALESSQFQDGLGPAVVVPNAVVLDHICWRTVTRHDDTQGELSDERLRLWTMLWGAEDSGDGYLATLDDDEQLAILELLSSHHVEALMLASMYDVYSAADYDTDLFRWLRRLQRRLLVHPMWQPTASTLAAAASLINARTAVAETVGAASVAEMVYDTVARTDPQEVRSILANIAGARPADIEFEDVLVSVDGTRASTKVVQATIHNIDQLDSDVAERFLAAWAVFEELPRYRLKAGKTVAWYSLSEPTASWYDRATDEELVLTDLEGVWPDWLIAADALVGGIEDQAGERAL